MRAVLKDKGQVTLPKRVRQKLGAETGDIFEVEIVAGKVVLTPQRLSAAGAASPVDLDRYFGALSGKFGTVEQIDRAIRKGRDEWD